MLRATIRISRAGTSGADRTMANSPPTAANAAPAIATRLTNEHPGRIHHSKPRDQSQHDRRVGEARRRGRSRDLPRQLVDDLGDGPGAEAEAENGRNGRMHE